VTKEKALTLLKTAPVGEKPAAVNKIMSQAKAVEIIRKGVETHKDHAVLHSIYVKRVWQVVLNKKSVLICQYCGERPRKRGAYKCEECE
jgi:hypothetical protein